MSNGRILDNEMLAFFAGDLVTNTTLKTMHIPDFQNNIITAQGWTDLSNILFNVSSIDNIYSSNHSLRTLGDYSGRGVPEDIVSLLRMNENDNKSEVVRQKIIKYHFLNGDLNMEELVDMEMNVLPKVMSWVGRDGHGFTLFYKLLQNTPSVFDFDRKARAGSVKG